MRLEPDFDLVLERPDIDEDILGRIDGYSFEQVYDAALETQPQIKAQQLRIESAILGEKLAKGARYPTLSLGASAVTNWTNLDKFVSATETVRTDPTTLFVNDVPVEVSQDVDVPTEFQTTAYGTQFTDNLGFGVSLNLRIPIYSNYQLKADQERSRLNILRAQNQDELIKQDLKTNIQNALSSAYAAREALEASEAAFDAAEVAYDNSERRFDLGALNSYDFIQARNRLDAARVNVTLAKFDYVFRILVLEYYLGRGVIYE
jgi:outer membrane protein